MTDRKRTLRLSVQIAYFVVLGLCLVAVGLTVADNSPSVVGDVYVPYLYATCGTLIVLSSIVDKIRPVVAVIVPSALLFRGLDAMAAGAYAIGYFTIFAAGLTALLPQMLHRSRLLGDYLDLRDEVELLSLSVDELRQRLRDRHSGT